MGVARFPGTAANWIRIFSDYARSAATPEPLPKIYAKAPARRASRRNGDRPELHRLFSVMSLAEHEIPAPVRSVRNGEGLLAIVQP